jgi:hypothetical protein
MDFNRNQFFFLGMFILLIGIQMRTVDTFVLSPEATKFLAERSGNATVASAATSPGAFIAANTPANPMMRKSLHPPEWLGWCLVSIGAVLVLHSLAMPRPS